MIAEPPAAASALPLPIVDRRRFASLTAHPTSRTVFRRRTAAVFALAVAAGAAGLLIAGGGAGTRAHDAARAQPAPPGIYHANIELIRAADAVLANLNPFRGCEPDSGTCVEVGFALALGKPVIGYLGNAETTTARVERVSGTALAWRDGRPLDQDGLYVEDFGLPLNLMLAVPVRIVIGGLGDAVQAASAEGAGL